MPGPGSAAAYATAVIADSPIGYYRLQETSGTTAADSSGHGRDGTITSGVTLGASGPMGEKAMSNWTSGGVVQIPSSVSFATNAPSCVEFWANLPSSQTGHQGSAFGLSTTVGRYQAHFTWSDGDIYWDTPIFGVGRPIVAYPSSALDTWAHFVFLYMDANSQDAIWCNGTKIATASASLAGSGSVSGGNIGQGLSFTCAAALAEFAVYNYALSDTQISNHYNATDVIATSSVRDPTHQRIPGIC